MRVARYGLCNLYHLLGGNGQIFHRPVHWDVHIQIRQDGFGLPAHLFKIHRAQQRNPVWLAVEKHVFGHAQVRYKRQLLINGNDPMFMSGVWAAKIHRLPSKPDETLVFGIHARQDLNEGGLSGTVFTHQAYDLARIHLKIHLLQRLNAGEVFGDFLQLQ